MSERANEIPIDQMFWLMASGMENTEKNGQEPRNSGSFGSDLHMALPRNVVMLEPRWICSAYSFA